MKYGLPYLLLFSTDQFSGADEAIGPVCVRALYVYQGTFGK